MKCCPQPTPFVIGKRLLVTSSSSAERDATSPTDRTWRDITGEPQTTGRQYIDQFLASTH